MLRNVKDDRVIHLTVGTAGVVSLWDSRDAAIRGRQRNDSYIPVTLTEEQVDLLVAAHEFAKAAHREPVIAHNYTDVDDDFHGE